MSEETVKIKAKTEDKSYKVKNLKNYTIEIALGIDLALVFHPFEEKEIDPKISKDLFGKKFLVK